MDLIAAQRSAPAVNQIETHPFHQQVADPEVPAGEQTSRSSRGDRSREGKNNIFPTTCSRSVGEKYGKSRGPGRPALAHAARVVAIPKSVAQERMAENLDVFDFQLTAEDMSAIAELGHRTSAFFDHRDPEGREEAWHSEDETPYA